MEVLIAELARTHQFRVRQNEQTVEDYAAALQEGATFPPVRVAQLGDERILVDGYHRVAAAERVGRTTIEAEVVEASTALEVKRAALTANQRHGLPRSREDKRRQVLEYLADPDLVGMSDRAIARELDVSQPFVGKLRRLQALGAGALPAEPTFKDLELCADEDLLRAWEGSARWAGTAEVMRNRIDQVRASWPHLPMQAVPSDWILNPDLGAIPGSLLFWCLLTEERADGAEAPPSLPLEQVQDPAWALAWARVFGATHKERGLALAVHLQLRVLEGNLSSAARLQPCTPGVQGAFQAWRKRLEVVTQDRRLTTQQEEAAKRKALEVRIQELMSGGGQTEALARLWRETRWHVGHAVWPGVLADTPHWQCPRMECSGTFFELVDCCDHCGLNAERLAEWAKWHQRNVLTWLQEHQQGPWTDLAQAAQAASRQRDGKRLTPQLLSALLAWVDWVGATAGDDDDGDGEAADDIEDHPCPRPPDCDWCGGRGCDTCSDPNFAGPDE